MKLEAFSVRDIKGEIFASPFFVPNLEIAKRLMIQLVQDARTDLGKYPADFHLYSIGFYETDTGCLTPHLPQMVCTATSCLPRPAHFAPAVVDPVLVSDGSVGARSSENPKEI